MTKITLYCQGAAAWARVEGSITAGAVGIPVEVECDGAWDGLTKTLVCMSAGRKIPLVLGGSAPKVAWEVLIPGLHLYLGLEGRNAAGDIIIPTTWADCGQVQPSAEDSHSGKPTPTEIEQLLTLAGAAAENGRRAIAMAETLKNSLVGSEDVEAAVGKWLDSHADAVSGLSAVGAAADQVPVAAGNGTWHWQDLPAPGHDYDDTPLRSAISALQQANAGKLDIQQSPQDAGKVLSIGPSGILTPAPMSGSMPDNAVLYQEDDEEDHTLEELLMDKLSLESDGAYIYLLCGDQELGRVEAGTGGGGSTAVLCTGVALVQSDMTVDVDDGEEIYLAAQVTPVDCTQTVRWTSSNQRAVTVNGEGMLTLVGAGTAVVTAKCGGYSDSITVTVTRKRKQFTVHVGGVEMNGNTALTYYRENRASVQEPMLIYVGEGAKVTVKCNSTDFYFGPTGWLVSGTTQDLNGPEISTSGRVLDAGWQQGEYHVTASGWTHLAVAFRYGSGLAFTDQVLETLKNAVTIEVE